jgi:histidinol dehydrogenase
MNVVPAQVAGVRRIVLCSPAQKEYGGDPHPLILAAAELLGIEEVYAIGGASAIAALAEGIDDIGLEKVDLVTGPGNAYVATAKQLLRSKIAIDSEAGPTEILIIADEKANPKWIAADLISQAEHDESAAAVLLSTSSKLIEEVKQEIELQLAKTANRERATKALSGEQSALVLVESISDAIEIANLYATEHLEIQTERPRDVLQKITNAGAVFLGGYSPVSLGDYLAGSNHVLPTSGQARRSSGLSVYTFLRQQQVVDFESDALVEVSDLLTKFADAEGLPAHGEAARIRFSN